MPGPGYGPGSRDVRGRDDQEAKPVTFVPSLVTWYFTVAPL